MRAALYRLTLTLFAMALGLRLLIAPGLMPVASPHGVRLSACPGQMPHHRDAPAKPTCPFAAVAAPAVAAVAPLIGSDTLRPMPLATPARTASGLAPAPSGERPPSTGPPRTA